MLYFTYIAYSWMCTSLRSSSFDKHGVLGFLFLWSLWVGCWGFTLGNRFVHVNIFLIGPPETLDIHSHGWSLQCLYSSGFCGCSYLTWPVSSLRPKSATKEETRPLSCQEALPSFKYFSFYQRHLLNRNWPENGRTCCCACSSCTCPVTSASVFQSWRRRWCTMMCARIQRSCIAWPTQVFTKQSLRLSVNSKDVFRPWRPREAAYVPGELISATRRCGKKDGPRPHFGWIWREKCVHL